MSRLEEFRKRRNEIGTQYENALVKDKDLIKTFAKYCGAVLCLLFDELETLIELYENHTPEKGED